MDIGSSDFSDYENDSDYLNNLDMVLYAFCVEVNTSQ